MKIKTILENIGAINNLMTQTLPAKEAYKLKRLVDKLKPVLEIYNEQKDKLITKYGEKDKDKHFINEKSPRWAEYMAEYTKLVEVEEDIKYEKLSLSALDGLKVLPTDISDFVFNYEDEKVTKKK